MDRDLEELSDASEHRSLSRNTPSRELTKGRSSTRRLLRSNIRSIYSYSRQLSTIDLVSKEEDVGEEFSAYSHCPKSIRTKRGPPVLSTPERLKNKLPRVEIQSLIVVSSQTSLSQSTSQSTSQT